MWANIRRTMCARGSFAAHIGSDGPLLEGDFFDRGYCRPPAVCSVVEVWKEEKKLFISFKNLSLTVQFQIMFELMLF